MLKKRVIFVLPVLAVFLFTGICSGADVAKIGIVDIQKILDVSKAGKAATKKINKETESMKKNLQRQGRAIEAMKKKLEKEALVMSKKARDSKEREIRIKINDFKTQQKKYNKELSLMHAKLVGKLKKGIVDIVRSMGKRESYLIIMEKVGAGVLYSLDSIDITDRVVKKYDSGFRRKR